MSKYLFSSEKTKWSIEGRVSIKGENSLSACGEAEHYRDEEGGIFSNRMFSAQTDDSVFCFEFEETLSETAFEKDIYKYKANLPFLGGAINGLYVLSFEAVHSMYSEEEGHASGQEFFIKQNENSYVNNGIIFKNGMLYLKWSLVYSVVY